MRTALETAGRASRESKAQPTLLVPSQSSKWTPFSGVLCTSSMSALVDGSRCSYRVLEKLGGAGMGVVYRAEDRRWGATLP